MENPKPWVDVKFKYRYTQPSGRTRTATLVGWYAEGYEVFNYPNQYAFMGLGAIGEENILNWEYVN